MEIPLLKDIVIILGLSMVVLFLGNRLKIPTIVGYLLTGMVSGPAGFALVKAVHEVEVMAEIGIILLLFTLGLEFSISKLSRLKKAVFLGGTTQVLFTILLVTGSFVYLDISLNKSVFLGFLVALSSTAIVLKILQEKAAIETPHGNSTLGILIFQDIIIVPMILLVPFLAGTSASNFSAIEFAIKLIILFALLYVGQKWLIPFILHQVTRTRNRELFLLTIAFLTFSIAWLTSEIGLSLALGAFLSGLLISESEYSHSALSSVLPMKDIFLGFFFVSIGMLLNFRTILDKPYLILLLFIAVLIIKLFTASLAILIMRYPLRTALLVAISLAQIGEFSFILSRTGMDYGLMTDSGYQIFLAVSVLSMMMTPFFMEMEKAIEKLIDRWKPPGKSKSLWTPDTPPLTQLEDHLVIVGYGLNGKNLTRTAQSQQISFVVIDLNPDTVRSEQQQGLTILYGDATYPDVLIRAGIDRARILVIVINDAVAIRKIVRQARLAYPGLYIIVRTRFLQEVDELYRLGANEVFPEEFETSVAIFTSVLRKYLTPEHQIDELRGQIRAEGYKIFREFPLSAGTPAITPHSEIEIEVLEIPKESRFVGKTIAEVKLLKNLNLQPLVVLRGKAQITHPGNDFRLLGEDELIVLGKPEDIKKFQKEL
jgi:CPA2 family monovalent cation:H+ antiporter-2